MNIGFKRTTSKVALFLIAGGLAGSLSLAFDALLLGRGVPSLGVLLVSNIITAAAGGALLLQVSIRRQEKQQVLENRRRKIADMNHHVRNALVLVAFYGTQGQDTVAVKIVSEAVKRIEWALREVLPKGWDMQASNPSSHGSKLEASSSISEQH